MRLGEGRGIAEGYFEFQKNQVNIPSIKNRQNESKFSQHPSKPSAATQLAWIEAQREKNWQQLNNTEKFIREELFAQWRWQMEEGFSLCMYGYGSKGKILEEFVRYLGLDDHQVSWHTPWSTLKQNHLAPPSTRHKNIPIKSNDDKNEAQQAPKDTRLLIVECAEHQQKHLPNLFHKIDTSLPVIITIEHCLANHKSITSHSPRPILYHNCTTMRPYTYELQMTITEQREDSLDADRLIKGAKIVLDSLPVTAKYLLKLLIEHQCATLNDEDDLGEEEGEENSLTYTDSHPRALSSSQWYTLCQQQFLVSNEMAFKTQISEFIDHQIIRQSEEDATYWCPFSKTHLSQLMQYIKQA